MTLVLEAGLALLAAFCATLTLIAQSPKPATMQVILLGTGYPRPDPDRAGPSNAIIVGQKVFIVDAGRGVMMRLAATGIPIASIHTVFLTHLHSDHTAGLPDLFATTWVLRRAIPLELYGPEGTDQLSKALLDYFAADIHIRRDLQEMLPAAGATINTHIVHEGMAYQDEEVKITAFLEDHRPVEPAFGYRFDSRGKSVVISGDTRPNENLIRYAKDADVLVQEAYLPEHFDRVDPPEVAAKLKHYHTSAEEAGQIAAKASVKLLVLTHLVPGDADATFLERAGKYFHGKIVVGHDLMRF